MVKIRVFIVGEEKKENPDTLSKQDLIHILQWLCTELKDSARADTAKQSATTPISTSYAGLEKVIKNWNRGILLRTVH